MAKQRPIEGLNPELPFALAGARVVETRIGEVIAHSEGVLDTSAIEGVHDMRVATRRLRAALEVFAPCFERERHSLVLREVKAIADALGERRDRDVAIDSLDAFAEAMPRPDRPGITSLIDVLRDEQLEANKGLAAYVEPDRLERLREAVLELTAAAAADGQAPGT